MKKSDYLRSLFRLKKIKVKDVAFRMGIAPSSLSAKINGHRIFKEKEIDILLEMLDMKYEEVFQIRQTSIIDDDKKIVIIEGKKFEVSKNTASKITKMINDKEVV